ncbi:hypothetical protein BD408DRAFT_409586 [Parasitella parasitica]|nr:hypothetical protein BD408DRAFT_409586 [Parasitella parasitica]
MDNSTVANTDSMLGYGRANPDKLEIASELTSLACITVLALAFGAKTYGEKLKSLNYGRLLVLLLYACSWAFAATSIVVVSTNNNNLVSCTIGMLACDVFYSGSKIIIYAWLIERVHVVTAVKTTRLKTNQYRFHILLLCPYIIIAALMLSFRNIYLEPDGSCTIGLQLIASVPLLVYDFIFNFYLTWLFIKPLRKIGRNSRQDWKSSRLYKLSKRTLVASIVCLSVSFINVLFVVLTHGHERGLVCLTMCTVDVTVNVVTVHWVTTSGPMFGLKKNRTKLHNDEPPTAEMTFDGAPNHEKATRYDIQMVEPDIVDDEDDSIISAKDSQSSENPINQRYN